MRGKGGQRLRFTGVSPPFDLWRKYPIWEYCLDEEGAPDQDETTIRPSREKYWQPRPGFDPSDVAGEASLPDGRLLPAMLGIAGDRALYLSIFFNPPRLDGESFWRLRFDDEQQRWTYDHDEGLDRWFRMHHGGKERPRVSLSDPSVFPLRVTTFAPKQKRSAAYALVVMPDGHEIETIS